MLLSLDDEHRRAVIALAVDEGLQLGVAKAALEHWPDALPRTAPTAVEPRVSTSG